MTGWRIELGQISSFLTPIVPNNIQSRPDELSVKAKERSLIFRHSRDDFPTWVFLKHGLEIRCGLQPHASDIPTLIENLSVLGVPRSNIYSSNLGVSIVDKDTTILMLKIEYDEDLPDAHYLHGWALLGYLHPK